MFVILEYVFLEIKALDSLSCPAKEIFIDCSSRQNEISLANYSAGRPNNKLVTLSGLHRIIVTICTFYIRF